ncbi:hypothetical protein CBM2629_A60156 [Cupriavidus taiwanensis]|nr:hypothetical protein CBM2629_A60156 [Cupriavidus taiwanensis]
MLTVKAIVTAIDAVIHLLYAVKLLVGCLPH